MIEIYAFLIIWFGILGFFILLEISKRRKKL